MRDIKAERAATYHHLKDGDVVLSPDGHAFTVRECAGYTSSGVRYQVVLVPTELEHVELEAE